MLFAGTKLLRGPKIIQQSIQLFEFGIRQVLGDAGHGSLLVVDGFEQFFTIVSNINIYKPFVG
jgi:hypothetical protein